MNRAFACLSTLAAAALFAVPAAAFDCSKASTRTEKAICADADLKKADDAMSAAYDAVAKRTPPAHVAMLKIAQRAWLKARDEQCAGEVPDAKDADKYTTCLLDQTTARIDVFSAKPEAGPGLTKQLTPIFVWHDADKKTCSVDVTVFEFGTAAATPGEKAFDAYVDKLLGSWAHDYGTKEDPDFECYYEAGTQITWASDSIFSVSFGISMYGGGAHPNSDATAVIADLKGGKLLAFKDVFDAKAKKPLIDACTAGIKAAKSENLDQIEDPASKKEAIAGLDEEMAGYAEEIEKRVTDFSNWSVTEAGATIYFPPYAVGSYAEGPYNCDLPKDLLQKTAAKGWIVP